MANAGKIQIDHRISPSHTLDCNLLVEHSPKLYQCCLETAHSTRTPKTQVMMRFVLSFILALSTSAASTNAAPAPPRQHHITPMMKLEGIQVSYSISSCNL